MRQWYLSVLVTHFLAFALLSLPLSLSHSQAAEADTTLADHSKSVALIIDASGSMQARLKTGERRIEAAKKAVKALIEETDDEIRLALRAYGHQSHRRKKNCRDTQLLTRFAPIGHNRDDVIARAEGLTAQGYTPISLVLELAAKDLGAEREAASRVVVLVSDGKETCEGDPCAVVKALTEADASLVVHTIGFAVDVAARYQLQCIARYGRGTYFEADDAGKLAEKLSVAVKSAAALTPKAVSQEKAKPGTLRLKNPSASRHGIYDAATNKRVGMLSAVTPSVALPAGFYQVKFGNVLWRSIEIIDGEETTIETAILKMPNASYKGHPVEDWETGEVVGKLSSLANTMNVIPSSFVVKFGSLSRKVNLKPGEVVVVPAGSVKFKGLPMNSRVIIDSSETKVISVSALSSSATLPAGDYSLLHNGKRIPFNIKDGVHVEVALPTTAK